MIVAAIGVDINGEPHLYFKIEVPKVRLAILHGPRVVLEI